MDYNNKNPIILSYCSNTYPHSYGGVSRFDYCLSLIFPNRIFFKGPQQIKQLLEYISKVNNYIIITDNHLASQFPSNIPLIIVHHGVARTHLDRESDWDKKWKDLCVYGQDMIFHTRNVNNTLFVSPSQFCINEFERIYGERYKVYNKVLIPHASELNENLYKDKFNKKPIIIGNWSSKLKGQDYIEKLKKKLPEFEFKNMDLSFENKTIDKYNKLKQLYYLNGDIYLCLSKVEGASYSTIDAMLCNLLIVSTDVGIMENEVSKESFQIIEWNNLDIDLVCEKIKLIWKNKDKYNNKSREEYFKIISWEKWRNLWYKIVHDFSIKNLQKDHMFEY